MIVKRVAECLREAAKKLDTFANVLPLEFELRNDMYVEPGWNGDVRTGRPFGFPPALILSQALGPLHNAMIVMEFRHNGEVLDPNAVWLWAEAMDGEWSAPAQWRELCARIVGRARAILGRDRKYPIRESIKGSEDYRQVIPLEAEGWAREMAKAFRADAAALDPQEGPDTTLPSDSRVSSPYRGAAGSYGMDGVELKALRRLNQRELWPVDELPSDLDADMLRCLDAEGLIEARVVVAQNCSTFQGETNPRWAPSPQVWFSPLKAGAIWGTWDAILKARLRDARTFPSELRVSEHGRVALTRAHGGSRATGPRPVEAQPAKSDDWQRLKKVQTRVRDLSRQYPWVTTALRDAFVGYIALLNGVVEARNKLEQAQRAAARRVLARRVFADPRLRKLDDSMTLVRIDGPCPAKLAKELAKPRKGAMPKALEAKRAAAALAALDREELVLSATVAVAERLKKENRAFRKSGSHVAMTWHVRIVPPRGHELPPRPDDLSPRGVERFNSDELRTIALFRLGGLADAGAVQRIVRRPHGEGGLVRAAYVQGIWNERLPVKDGQEESAEPQLDPAKLSPDIAEQLLVLVEDWVRNTLAKSGGSGSAQETAPAVPTRVQGWTKAALIEATRGPSQAPISPSTFDRIRKAARVPGGRKGSKGKKYYVPVVIRMLNALDEAAPQSAYQVRCAWQPLVQPPANEES